MHIGVLVFLRMFTIPLLLLGGFYYVNNHTDGPQKAAVMNALTPGLAEIQRQFEALGASASSALPIAEAKFTSGRSMMGQTLNLSGGGFVRP